MTAAQAMLQTITTAKRIKPFILTPAKIRLIKYPWIRNNSVLILLMYFKARLPIVSRMFINRTSMVQTRQVMLCAASVIEAARRQKAVPKD